MSMIPKSKPMASQATIREIAASEYANAGNAALPDVFLVGVRGYYRDTMGASGKNDRGIYDDAVFVFGPGAFASFNANTDPSAFKAGVASLVPGIHWYRPGNHGISKPGGGYPAFRPATKNEALPVRRDGQSDISQGIAINIHRGGNGTTSSLGCQTIPPAQWDAFHALLTLQLKKAGLKSFPYILLTGPVC